MSKVDQGRLYDGRRLGVHLVSDSIYDAPVSVYAKAAYGYLSRCANKDGVCWPSTKTIAVKIGASARSVRYGLRELQDHGYLRVESNAAPGSVNLYHLIRPETPAAGASPAAGAGGECGKTRDETQPVQGGAAAGAYRRVPIEGLKEGRNNVAVLSDDDFIAKLKESEAYRGIDVDRELAKLDAWLLTPRGRGKSKTRQRIVNWLNRADRPMATSVSAAIADERPWFGPNLS